MARQSQEAWFRKAKNAWYAKIDGKQVALGVRGKENRKAAREAWLRLLSAPPVPPVKPEPKVERIGVRGLIDGFLGDVAGRAKPKTVEVYRFLLGVFVETFGDRAAEGIRPNEVEAFARRPSWSASTRNGFLTALVTAYRWAVRARLLGTSPLTDVRKPPKGSRGAKVTLTSDQFTALSAACPPAFCNFLTGLWLTGCRPGELARLEAANVDFKAGVAILAEHKTAEKAGKPRVIYLSPEAVAMFRDLAGKHPTGPLFPNNRGKAWSGWAVVKAMEAARTKAAVPHATAYGLRHSFATDALASGVPDAAVAELLGHSGTAMLHKHYAHLTAKANLLRNAAAMVRPGADTARGGTPQSPTSEGQDRKK